MRKYKSVEVSERQLEDLIRQGPELIEDGLRFIDHQRMTDRGPLDVLMVDSGNALVIAELKVTEDDSILVQGMDYYDYLQRNIEGISRVYKDFLIDPTQTIRLFMIAPSFSVTLLNRCKWLDIPISVFSFKCIALDDPSDIVPVFTETTLPVRLQPQPSYKLNDRLGYITDQSTRDRAEALIDEVRSWNSAKIAVEPTKYDISLKVSGRVFSYIGPRRKHFVVYTYDAEQKWTGFPVHQDEDVANIRTLLKANIERLA